MNFTVFVQYLLNGFLDSSVVEDDYDGPRLSEDGVTKEFVEELIERFRDQKKIHKKYAYKVNMPLFLISMNSIGHVLLSRFQSNFA